MPGVVRGIEALNVPVAFNESLPLVLALVLTVSATLAFGLYPAPLIELARASTMLVP